MLELRIFVRLPAELYRRAFLWMQMNTREQLPLLDAQELAPKTAQLRPLPAGWKYVKLGEVCESISYGYTAKAVKEDVGPRILRITDIQNGFVDWANVPFCLVGEDEKQKYLLRKNDIVFARSGNTVGKTFLIRQDISNVVFASYLIRVRLISTVEARCIYYYFQTKQYWQKIQEGQSGIGQPNFNGTKLSQLSIPLPPLSEQHRIVAKIEELFSEIDKGVEQLQAARAQLKVYRQAVLKWAFEGKLTEKWRNHNPMAIIREDRILGDLLVAITAGKSFKCDERPPTQQELGVVKVSAVTWSVFNELESKTCYDDSVFNEKFLIRKGDFLFSRANTVELVGACVIVTDISLRLLLSDKTLRLTFSSEVEQLYILYFLRSQQGRRQIETLATGNQESMRNIGQDKIKRISIPFCSLEEQRAIVHEIEARLSVCDSVERTIEESLQRAEALRQSILKRAFEGKLVPQQP